MAHPDDARTLWDAAVALNRTARPVSGDAKRSLPPLLFFTDPVRTPEPWRTAAGLPAGAAVIYRHFGAVDAEATAQRLRAATTERNVLLLISLDAPLAARVGADGVHLPERALDQASAIRGAHPDWMITGALHAPNAGAADEVVDAFVLSPIFRAGGVSSVKPALGVGALKQTAAILRRPIYALGGITAETVGALSGSGACGIAGVDAIVGAFGLED